MKRYCSKSLLVNVLILITLFSAFTSQAQFTTKWKTTLSNESITIPTFGFVYNYSVDWGDGSLLSTGQTGNSTHIYANAGFHTVSITGTFSRIYFRGSVDAAKIIEISQWGNNSWTSMESAFYNCANLNSTALDAPVLSGVTDMSNMFFGCNSFNPAGAPATALSTWNTGNVTDMTNMFFGASSFNQYIGNWNTASVKSMKNMFSKATSFNQNIGSWNTAAVNDMSNMFGETTSFNQNIGSWNTASVKTMYGMFNNAASFNQNIGNWNTSSVTNMAGMFNYATNFNQNIGNWNTASVKDISAMFVFAVSFNGDIESWNTGAVTDMSTMFYGASLFNKNIGSWNTTSVKKMNFMFYNATSFNQNIGNWNISAVTDMTKMLDNSGLTLFNYDNTLIGWAAQTPKMNVPLGAANLTYCAGATARAILTSTYGWTVTGDVLDCSLPFITKWKTTTSGESITIPTSVGVYNYDVNWGDGSSVSSGQTGDATHSYATAGVYTVSISGIFPQISLGVAPNNQKIVEISQWGTIEWSSMSNAFFNCSNMNLTATDAPELSDVTDMSNMFSFCYSLNPLGAAATALNTWNTSRVTDMSGMFKRATSFNQNIGNWNTEVVDYMYEMFSGATAFNQNIGNWNTSDVDYMSSMFKGATSFNQNLGNWNISAVISMFGMLDNSGMSRFFYDKTLKGWDAQTVQNGVPLGALNVRYCNSVVERNDLINNHGWIITGDINDCSILPIDLISFNAQKSGTNAVQINWTSGLESNVSSISVQHSIDANNWKSIYTCEPKGSNSKYETLDNNPVSGTNYYRLLAIDLDGTQKYSDIKSVNFSSSLLPNVYPNPTSGSITIRNIKSGDVIVLTDLTGRQMLKKQAKAEKQMLDTHSLAQGMYFISIMRDGKVVMNDKITKM